MPFSHPFSNYRDNFDPETLAILEAAFNEAVLKRGAEWVTGRLDATKELAPQQEHPDIGAQTTTDISEEEIQPIERAAVQHGT